MGPSVSFGCYTASYHAEISSSAYFSFMCVPLHLFFRFFEVPLYVSTVRLITPHFPDFLIIPVIFYIVVAAAQLNMGDLRAKGWLFDMGSSGEDESWYTFYSYYGVSLSPYTHSSHSSILRLRRGLCRCWSYQIWAFVVDSADSICFVCICIYILLCSCCDVSASGSDKPPVRSRLFFNILHPPLNVPALCTCCFPPLPLCEV